MTAPGKSLKHGQAPLVAHFNHLRPLFAFILFLVEPPVMVFGLHHHSGAPSSPVAAGGKYEGCDDEKKQDPFHEPEFPNGAGSQTQGKGPRSIQEKP